MSSADGFVRGSIPRLDASETMHEAASSGFHQDAVGTCRDGGDMPGRQCQVPWLRLHGGCESILAPSRRTATAAVGDEDGATVHAHSCSEGGSHGSVQRTINFPTSQLAN